MACSTDSFPKESMRLASLDKVLVKCINHAIETSRGKMADKVLRRTIDEYMISFIGLYTANTLEGEIGIEIEDVEIYMDSGYAFLTLYSDKQGKCLRYKIAMYGETMDTITNYYLCNGFVLVSKQSDYYSNRLASTDGVDILCSKIENWVIYDDTIYMLHDDGELESIDDDHMPFLPIDEIDELMKYEEDAVGEEEQ